MNGVRNDSTRVDLHVLVIKIKVRINFNSKCKLLFPQILLCSIITSHSQSYSIQNTYSTQTWGQIQRNVFEIQILLIPSNTNTNTNTIFYIVFEIQIHVHVLYFKYNFKYFPACTHLHCFTI